MDCHNQKIQLFNFQEEIINGSDCSLCLSWMSEQIQKKQKNPFQINSPYIYGLNDEMTTPSLIVQEHSQNGEEQSLKIEYEESVDLYCDEYLVPDHISSETNNEQKKKQVKQIYEISTIPCNCARTRCQKMYCECLAKGQLCSVLCNCHNCDNRKVNQKLKKAQKQIKNNRNKRIKYRSSRFKSGCTCKKSQCLNNYCECKGNGKDCSQGCTCYDCKNKREFHIEEIQINTSHKMMEIPREQQFILGGENSEAIQKLNYKFYIQK